MNWLTIYRKKVSEQFYSVTNMTAVIISWRQKPQNKSRMKCKGANMSALITNWQSLPFLPLTWRKTARVTGSHWGNWTATRVPYSASRLHRWVHKLFLRYRLRQLTVSLMPGDRRDFSISQELRYRLLKMSYMASFQTDLHQYEKV